MRLSAQRIAGPGSASVAETVRWMGALQAQDYAASLWAAGLRTAGATVADVESAIRGREIVRTWPMRGTLHLISPELVRPVLRLCSPRIRQRVAGRHRQLEIDDAVIVRAGDIVAREVREHGPRTRQELYEAFASAGVRPDGQRGIHLIGQLARDGLICFGAHRGKQPTFVLLDDWVPHSVDVPDDEAAGELALRYFRSHGPATVHDFAWWSNLTVKEARDALDACSGALDHLDIDGTGFWFAAAAVHDESAALHLLPSFDEFVIGYTDRSTVAPSEHLARVVPGNNGMFMPAVVDSDGRLIGTWRKTVTRSGLSVLAEPFPGVPAPEEPGFTAAVRQYGTFSGSTLRSF